MRFAEEDGKEQADSAPLAGQLDIREAIFGNARENQEEELEVIEAPVEDLFQISDVPEMAEVDQKVIKLTAQYVAANGQSFLQKLARRLK